MEHHSVERRAVIVFAKIIFPASFFFQKKAEILEFSETDSTLPTAFLNFDAHFLEMYSQDPFAYCLAALTTS